MKTRPVSFLVCVILAGALTAAFAGAGHGSGGGSSGSASAGAAGHGSGSSPAGSVSFAPAHHYSGQMMSGNLYRPGMTPGVGTNRTLYYPGVRNSTVRHLSTLHTESTAHISSVRGSATNGNLSLQKPVFAGHKLDPQTSARLRNWNGKIDSAHQAKLNHLEHSHHHHNHDWWRHHCLAFVFFDFGWWGWDDGWWYPAWGYSNHSYYDYDEPIYGYNGMSPEQIVAGVQAALQQLGYYQYAIDGRMGPLTRSAIGRFQTDHRLPVTYAVDPTTLGSLGIIR
jgi:Putative peptidoglycan binding domain